MKILLLLPHIDYFYNQYSKYVDTYYIFKDVRSRLLLALRRLHFMFSPFYYSIWFTKELKEIDINSVEKLIIFDSRFSIDIANYFKRKNPLVEVIIYYRNHIDNPLELTKVGKDISVWSYDKEDCEKYNIKYNSQFYFSSIFPSDTEYEQKFDFFFIGQIKGRLKIINEIKESLIKRQYKVFFHVIDETNKSSCDYTYLGYNDVLELICKSKCVVDIVGEWQTGMTLRPLEALFFHKKLLTNFKDISKYDFYSPRNIFIFGVDDIDNLDSFLKAPFEEESLEYMVNYDFPNWIRKF